MRGDLTRRLAIDQTPTSGDADSALMTPQSPSAEYTSFRIGPYKLLQMLGEGGFGCVYLAEQDQPVRRKVALKILKLGMDTKQVIGRFEAERQALAMMDHPNIAKVLDGGATESGRPYFVMELVKGVPITEYCDTNQLSTKERLVLFMLVCHAVQHAHQKGIIHRDIKPSNVMIAMHDGKPVPKVIDFGIAKVLDQKLTEKTVYTEMRQLIGTPEYMSPEQAEMTGIDIDTRSDVYSLGVVLYELLTGTTPFDAKELREAGYGEIQRIIREVEPLKPSTRLSTMGDKLTDVAKRRKVEPRLLAKSLRGDLDWIVMKCLEKDRTRRYDTVNGLAMDVLRYLCDEPVLATPPSWRYRADKFIRRNKALIGTSAFVAASLVLGITLAITGLVNAKSQRNAALQAQVKASKEADRAKAAAKFLTDLILLADPNNTSAGRSVTVVELLDRAAERASHDFSADPLTEAEIRFSLAVSYENLDLVEKAEQQIDRAVTVWRAHEDGQNRNIARALRRLGRLRLRQEEFAKSEEAFKEALRVNAQSSDRLDDLSTSTLYDLGRLYHHWGKFKDGYLALERALALLNEQPSLDYEAVAACNYWLSRCRLSEHDFIGAERFIRKALEANEMAHPKDHWYFANANSTLAACLIGQRKYDEAERLLLAALPVLERAVGTGAAQTRLTLERLIDLYEQWGRTTDAKVYRDRLAAIPDVDRIE